MSHDGIRFVSEEESQRLAREHGRELSREATEPLHVRVQKTAGTGMEIDWKDGHHSQWTFQWLRDACPCATCHEERGTDGRKPGVPKPRPGGLLQMYKEPVRPESASPVGRYAITFRWNDSHQSGIYSWDYLRRSCQCADCRATVS